MSYTDEFLAEAVRIIHALPVGEIEKIATELVALRVRSGRLFIVGSGGGAGHASHAVADFRKIARIEAYSPTDNVSELTARINDEGWESSYAEWLRVSRLGAADMLLVLSVGGGDAERGVSANLVHCVELAREVGARIGCIVGRDGGYAARYAHASVVVPALFPATVTAHTEGLQALIWHLLVSHPAVKAAEMRWESLR